ALARARVEEARARDALARATAEAAKARQVTQFVTSLLQSADPFRPGSRAGAAGAAGATDMLALGAERLDRELAGQPDVRAELLRTLAEVQRNRGRYAQADTLLRRGLAERRRALGGAGPDAGLGRLLADLGTVRLKQSDFAGADTLLTQALALYGAVDAALPDPGASLAAARANARFELGVVRRLVGRPAEAERLFRQALAVQRLAPDTAAALTLTELAFLRTEVGDRVGSEALRREALAVVERALGPDHPRVARFLEFLADALVSAGHLDEAERTARRALAIERRHLPPGHPDALTTASILSIVLVARGELAEAERLQRQVLAGRRRLLGDSARDVAGSLYVLGRTRRLRGDVAEATRLLTRSLATYDRASGGGDPDEGAVLAELADVAHQSGREADALRFAARLRRSRGEAVWDAEVQDLATLAGVLRDDGDCRGAARLYRRARAAYAVHAAPRPGRPSADDPPVATLRAQEAACRARPVTAHPATSR
ncbi:MAG TPA: tetratricopeptide repeat protein, partial [Gemmatirosa sp.]